MGAPVIADRLRDGENVRFGERAIERRAPMAAGAEADHLVRVDHIGPALEIFAFKPGDVDQASPSAPACRPAARCSGIAHVFYSTGHGFTPQISLAYSAIVRSLENFPDAATFRMALRAHSSGSA